MTCPHCNARLSRAALRQAASEYGRLASAKRSISRAGGRPPVLRKCGGCGKQFSVTEMRKHRRECK